MKPIAPPPAIKEPTGTYMFLKEKETPAPAKDAKGKGGKATATPKQKSSRDNELSKKQAKFDQAKLDSEQEAKDIEDLKVHIVANQFDWLKDGKKKNGEF